MDRRSKAVLSLSIVMTLALLVPVGAMAKGKPTVEATNNLSVPAIMLAGGGFTGVTCGTNAFSVLVPPTGTPLTGYPTSPLDFYYVQGVHKWQAPCNNSTAVDLPVTAGWGDNLSGDAKLKAGSPIRVELGLFNTTSGSVEGYTVIKLDPAALDRASPYGTLATYDGTSAFSATPTVFETLRVFDKAVTLTITNVTTGAVVFSGPATAEINATGNIVYGYNLRVTTAGQYLIAYDVPTALVTSADAGDVDLDGHGVSLLITVGSGGGSGGGKPVRP
jgi:hypothetical protein